MQINIVRAHREGCAAGAALSYRDGDALTVGQGEHQGAAGNQVGHRRGVNDRAAFGHARRAGGEGHRRRINRISDSRRGNCRINGNGDSSTTSAADRCTHARRVNIDIFICRYPNSGGAGELSRQNRDGDCVRQSYAQISHRCLRDRR